MDFLQGAIQKVIIIILIIIYYYKVLSCALIQEHFE